MGILGDSIEKASAATATATRPIPKSAGAQGSTKAVAQLLGISQRTVERYVKDQIRRPRRELAARIEREVRKRWQPKVRQKAQQRAAQRTGITIETRARFGFTAAPGTTDDGRIRLITQHLPPAYAARLLDAQAAGATEQQLQNIAAEGLQEIYFKDRGRRADGLLVEFTDIDYVEIDF
ncbi:telomere-protecting terminal protein Tpg [Streptomyces platensis]|uniref:telomere-protecting terminal protein Tpg n=1 Tax=Streptomyces platensis TaxID=58346 RepID=UPI002E80539E|nr:XRE family transcriptional regulator [Streptomyces platensis]WUB84548.1 XRE family transcriptional regulator [Streptomyces platensis]